MIGSIVLKPYIGIQSQERDIIVILSSINILLSLYYLWNVLNLHKKYRLESKNIIKFVKSIGIVTLIYIPHVFVFASLFLRNLNYLEILMISLIILTEILLIGLVLKQVYDLIFLEQSRRNAQIEKDRKKYFEKNNIT